jgi:hypothetical protein
MNAKNEWSGKSKCPDTRAALKKNWTDLNVNIDPPRVNAKISSIFSQKGKNILTRREAINICMEVIETCLSRKS